MSIGANAEVALGMMIQVPEGCRCPSRAAGAVTQILFNARVYTDFSEVRLHERWLQR